MMQGVAIGEAARLSGVKVPTIRYYEQIGLLPAPQRSKNNRRHFETADLRRLAFIRHARELGFEIVAIRSLLTLQDDPNQACATVHGIAKERLGEVVQRISSLTALKAELELMVEGCSHGLVGKCRVIEVLADHLPDGPEGENGSGPADRHHRLSRRGYRFTQQPRAM